MIIATQIQQRLQLDLPLRPTADMEGLLRHENRNSFLTDSSGAIIGLNICGNNLKNDRVFMDLLAEMPQLQALNASENAFEAIEIPDHLTELRFVDGSDCPNLRRLSLPAAAKRLERLDTSDSGLEQLILPLTLPHLTFLDGSRNQLTEVVLPPDCLALSYLDLSGNQIKELALIGQFSSLQYLYLPKNGMEVLDLPTQLPALKVLHLSGNQLKWLPQDIILSEHLQTLYAGSNRPKNIPDVFLGDSDAENCLATARLWFTEIRDFPTENNKRVKLMLTGNGDTGKSSLLCALENGKCSCRDGHHSTHGIQIKDLDKETVLFNVWDFGGQEIYHGTHRLFMESPAVQVLVFDPKTEGSARKGERKPDRINQELVLDQTLQYWFDTVKSLSPQSPFIVVQNKIDKHPDEDEQNRKLAKNAGAKFSHISAQKGTDITDVEHYIKTAAALLPEHGMVMPSSWLKVRQTFTDNLQLASEDRKKTISRAQFDERCTEHGVNEQLNDMLFRYLHHSGYLYHHAHLKDTIIIDQEWALTAIYKVLDRDAKHFKRMKDQQKGEMSVYEIFDIFGDSYALDEKKLILSFMETCGICFRVNKKESSAEFSEIDSYLFPEFLRDQLGDALVLDWQNRTKAVQLFRYKLAYPNYPRLLSFLTALGRKTEIRNIWRNGIQISTPEGWFRVMMNYDVTQPAIELAIEQSALAGWLKPIIEALDQGFKSDQGWQRKSDKSQDWEDFYLDKWTETAQITKMETEGEDKPLAEKIKDQPQESVYLRVLFCSANPKTTTLLSDDKEYKKISEGLWKVPNKVCKIDLIPISNITSRSFIDAVYEHKPHFIHFVGHGKEERVDVSTSASGLIFHADNMREEDIMDSQRLAATFKKIMKVDGMPLHTVFLNACLSYLVAEAISGEGLTVIGCNDTIFSDDARIVAVGFYENYSQDKNVKAALEAGLVYASHEESKYEIYQNGNKMN